MEDSARGQGLSEIKKRTPEEIWVKARSFFQRPPRQAAQVRQVDLSYALRGSNYSTQSS